MDVRAGLVGRRAHMWLLRGRTQKELQRNAEPLKSESTQIPKKTTSDSNTCERHQTASLTIPPPSNNTSAVPHRANANTQVIDADAW